MSAGARARRGLRNAARSSVAGSFASARAYHRASLLWDDRARRAPLVVYQMGKVGSQSVVRSLDAALGGPVFHVHYLTPEGVERAERIYRRGWDPRRDPDHLWDSYHLRRRLEGDRGDEPWKVVTLVRDPVARNLSAFFQVAALQFDVDLDRLGAAPDSGRTLSALTSLFLERYDEHEVPAQWFDDELRKVFDVDVYEQPFPARGWSHHPGRRADVLVLKLERLADTAEDALQAHLGVRPAPAPEVNVGTAKGYGSLYRHFIENVRLPSSYVDAVYASGFARHFYSADERQQLTARWVEGVGTGRQRLPRSS